MNPMLALLPVFYHVAAGAAMVLTQSEEFVALVDFLHIHAKNPD
jgi:hypothetical protein